MKPLRDILPAAHTGRSEEPVAREESESAPQSSSSSSRKRPQTRIACTPCRRRKSKCDGRRPVCTTCAAAGLQECEYDGDPDLTRAAALRKRNDELQRQIALYDQLFGVLSSRSEAESIDILRRIRRANVRTDLEELVRFINDGDLLVQLSTAGAAAAELEAGMPRAAAEALVASDEITALLTSLKTYVSQLEPSLRSSFLDAFKVRMAQATDAVGDPDSRALSTAPPSKAVSIISDSDLPSFQIRKHP
ncbi:hypothetical protein F5X68DRAFT_226609 [Plectosphaerella plurivora]|uniref:Zn(2)-C6 fungal-type domain-containing protein n=1 Tax=Plectosphaerella plurivora TaxID=936078 RepID=A0A9P8VP91_9PEZI|nr:hypothetical protein F5X68DRAFT_226609 [Plectosphaerella plurivora]